MMSHQELRALKHRANEAEREEKKAQSAKNRATARIKELENELARCEAGSKRETEVKSKLYTTKKVLRIADGELTECTAAVSALGVELREVGW